MKKSLKLNLESFEERLVPTAYTWMGGGNTNYWNNQTNWENLDTLTTGNGYPGNNGSGDIANLSGSDTIKYNINTFAGKISGSAYTGTLQVYGDMTVQNYSSEHSTFGSGTISIKEGYTVTAASGSTFDLNGTTFAQEDGLIKNGYFVVAGTVTISGTVTSNLGSSYFKVNYGGVLSVTGNYTGDGLVNAGVVSIDSAGKTITTSSDIDNSGILLNNNTGTTTFAAAVNNTGTIRISEGTVNFTKADGIWDIVNSSTGIYWQEEDTVVALTHHMKSKDNAQVYFTGNGNVYFDSAGMAFYGSSMLSTNEGATPTKTTVYVVGPITMYEYSILDMYANVASTGGWCDQFVMADSAFNINDFAYLEVGASNATMGNSGTNWKLIDGTVNGGFNDWSIPMSSTLDYSSGLVMNYIYM